MTGIQGFSPISYNSNAFQMQQNKQPAFKSNYAEPRHGNNEGEEFAKTAATATLLQIISSSLDKISGWFGQKLMNGKEFTTERNVVKVVDDMVKKHNLKIDYHFVSPTNKESLVNHYGKGLANELEVVARGENAFYADQLKLAVAPKAKPSLMPHEIGHAANAKNFLLKGLQKSRAYTRFAPLAVLLMSRFNNNPDKKPNMVERNAGLIGFCAYLPTVIEEGIASLRGIKQAGKTLGKGVSLAPLKRNYAFAWATYLIGGIALGLATKFAVVQDKLGRS